MKLIQDNKLLKVRAIKSLEDVDIKSYKKDVWIAKVQNEYYMIIKRNFKNSYDECKNKIVDLNDAKCKVCELNENINLNVKYGSAESFIVDMNGIDNFIFANSQVFNDDLVRKILLKLNLLDKNKQYLRFGCSGARENDFHPGGEVYESSLISGEDGSGISQNVSGYLPNGEEYSTSISLYDRDKIFLREERIVYSHTAFLDDCGLENSKCILIKIEPKKEEVSFLDILNELATELKLSSYAIQICIQSNTNSTKIKGRVLKHMPEKAFKVLQEATDIGLEQLFKLENTDIMYGVGTKYDRYEPEWKQFTGGRQYERRGHIHATVIGDKDTLKNKHEVFHLRDVFVNPTTSIQVVLTPINNIYRIYPIYKCKNEFFCKASNKNIDNVIENIRVRDRGD